MFGRPLTVFVVYNNQTMSLKDACIQAEINYASVYHLHRGFSLKKGESKPTLQEAFDYFLTKTPTKTKKNKKVYQPRSICKLDDPIRFNKDGMMIL